MYSVVLHTCVLWCTQRVISNIMWCQIRIVDYLPCLLQSNFVLGSLCWSTSCSFLSPTFPSFAAFTVHLIFDDPFSFSFGLLHNLGRHVACPWRIPILCSLRPFPLTWYTPSDTLLPHNIYTRIKICHIRKACLQNFFLNIMLVSFL